MTLIGSLKVLQVELHDALSRRDWGAVSELDPRCRALVAEIVAMESWGDSELRDQVSALSSLYADLQQAARAERERVAAELAQLNQSRRADQAYKTLG
ncbi:flagellar protein FliT [Stutzerimonas kunmingensis]|uniref:flagellar protein FliT n=1 Tax=Stutzerimonas kunmingensis TaxID=1211807 RepID=UPI000CC4E362|nr:flagellar protein FliT [Stutzerimonas kunmingensis]PKM04048.1 MAG: flagellar protein FliT [Gammaproteobacteria bacterium HGW-Gammaproteobacteria-6]